MLQGDRELMKANGYLGYPVTNNQAEYHGLLFALRFAVDKKTSKLTVYSDSQLMVRQVNGQYNVYDPKLQPLYREALSLISELPSFEIYHIPREQNTEADALATEALNAVVGD